MPVVPQCHAFQVNNDDAPGDLRSLTLEDDFYNNKSAGYQLFEWGHIEVEMTCKGKEIYNAYGY